MIIRLVLGIAVLLVAAWVARRYLLKPPATPGRNEPDQFEPTVPCARCGTYIPREQAIRVDDRHYCSEAHADADR